MEITDEAQKGKVEFTYEELMLQNKSLSEELIQCQKDKDFVWNLWKTLQAEKPDMTNIISTVVEREQQKSDAKDLKVLNILQQKDNQIKILQDISADLQAQLKQCNERLSDLLIQQSSWSQNQKRAEEEKKQMEAELDFRNELLKVKESQSNVLETESDEKLKELEQRNTDLLTENTNLQNEVKSLNLYVKAKQNEFEDLCLQLTSKEQELVSVIQKLDDECKQKQILFSEKEDIEKVIKQTKDKHDLETIKFEELHENLEIREEQIKKNIQTIQEQSELVEQQDLDLCNLRKQLGEHINSEKLLADQSELIKNLEHLQDETQKVLAHQQSSHQLEIASFQKTINDLTKKVLKLQTSAEKLKTDNKSMRESALIQNKEILERELEVEKLRKGYHTFADASTETISVRMDCSNCINLEEELNRCQISYDILLTNYNEQNRMLPFTQESFNKDVNTQSSSISEMETKQDIMRSHVQLETIEKLQNLIKSMASERKTTRLAHNQRLQRYKLLQTNYDLVLQQLATYENSPILSPKPKEKHIPRASPKSLQRENSKSVWNELEYFKREFNKLNKERPIITEELDELQVKLAHKGTVIQEMKLQLTEMNKILKSKEEETKEHIAESAQVYSLQKQVDIWKEKVYDSERDNMKMRDMYDQLLENEHLQRENDILHLKKRQLQQNIQTQTENNNSKQLLDKMNEVIEVVQSDRLTVSQLESSSTTQNKHSISLSTQTSPLKVHFKQNENSTQTDDITNDSDISNEKTKKKQKLYTETQRLLLLKSDIHHENRSLKKRVFTLEHQVSQLREGKRLMGKDLSEFQITKEKLKAELIATLQKLQVTREILQDRTSELEDHSQELQLLVAKQQQDDQSSKETAVECKALQQKLKTTASDYSKLSFQVKTLTGENEMLSTKLKDYQERISKLEKMLNQKKSYIDDLKERYDEVKDKNENNSDIVTTLNKKLKLATERETKNKTYIENLKSKVENMTADKVKQEESMSSLIIELNNKSHLLQESQRLCRQAESAIGEMEHSAYKQLQNQQLSYNEKTKAVKSRYEKCVSKVNEMKLSVKNFAEALLSQIHENQSLIMEKQRENATKHRKQKHEELLKNKARDIACSILNMSTADLEDFMMDEDIEIQPHVPRYKDNDIREKLDLILTKETNFGKIMTKFLLDLVQYNWNLLPQHSSV